MNKLMMVLALVPFTVACNQVPQDYVGPQGPAGQDAAPCSVATLLPGSAGAPNGGSLITCPDGTSSVVLNGTNGTNATSVTPVQFCPNVKPVYPSNFPESGLCIGGVMYGVYSANGGFLAALPPGVYSSDGINASCTFTIGTDCAVNQ